MSDPYGIWQNYTIPMRSGSATLSKRIQYEFYYTWVTIKLGACGDRPLTYDAFM
jgi:hypothetical protein